MHSVDVKRRMDDCKLAWHTERAYRRYVLGERVAPIHIDMGIAKFCNIKCVFCVAGTTKILMADFTWKEIRDIQVGDSVMGFDEKRSPDAKHKKYARYYPTVVTKVLKRRGRTHVLQHNSNSLRITSEHPVLCKGHRWRSVGSLGAKAEIRYFTEPYQTNTKRNYLYKLGYLKGVSEGDGSICSAIDKRATKAHGGYVFRKYKLAMKDTEAVDRASVYFKELFLIDMGTGTHKARGKYSDLKIIRTDKINEVDLIEQALQFRKPTEFSSAMVDYARGYLAGIFDAEGSLNAVLRIAQRHHGAVVNNIAAALDAAGYEYRVERAAIRLLGGFDAIAKFVGQCQPAITRKVSKMYGHAIPATVTATKKPHGSGGVTEDVYNLETEAHTYVANGFCVHNCYGMYQEPAKVFIQRDALIKTMDDAAEIGVRSIGFIGDGEPTCNPHVWEALEVGHKNGLDLALSTSGVLLNTPEKMDTVLESCQWMRFCFSAGTRDGYKKIHGVDKYDTVVENIRQIVEMKRKHGYECEIGMQAVFVPTLMLDEMIEESKLAVDLGVDYLVIKQCSLPDDGSSGMAQFDVNKYDDAEVQDTLTRCQEMSTDQTDIIPKWNLMAQKGHKPYYNCPSIALISEISGNGDWFPCGYMFGANKPQFADLKFGNLHEQSLAAIWRSDRYWKIVEHMENDFDVQKQCRGACRQDKCNEWVYNYYNSPDWAQKQMAMMMPMYTPKGVNFI